MRDASSNAPAPSLLRRPGCWITFLTAIPLLIGALYTVENWLGVRLAADGLELDQAKLPATRPPDAENFFTTPLLAAITSGTATGPEIEAVRRIATWSDAGSERHVRPQRPEYPAATDWAAMRDAIAAADDRGPTGAWLSSFHASSTDCLLLRYFGITGARLSQGVVGS